VLSEGANKVVSKHRRTNHPSLSLHRRPEITSSNLAVSLSERVTYSLAAPKIRTGASGGAALDVAECLPPAAARMGNLAVGVHSAGGVAGTALRCTCVESRIYPPRAPERACTTRWENVPFAIEWTRAPRTVAEGDRHYADFSELLGNRLERID
jgi:hypothetical protein